MAYKSHVKKATIFKESQSTNGFCQRVIIKSVTKEDLIITVTETAEDSKNSAFTLFWHFKFETFSLLTANTILSLFFLNKY